MRLLHVIRSVDPVGGGPIEGVKRITPVHEANGHSVETVSLDLPGSPCLAASGINVTALGNSGNGYGYSPKMIPWLRENRKRFDAVILHGLWQYSGFATHSALSRTDTPYFVFPHGMLDPWFKQRYPIKHLKKWLYWPWAEYRVLRDAKAVLFTCEEERLCARESFWLYRCNERVVSYGTATPPDDTEEQKGVFATEFPQLKGKRFLLFLSRIHEKKGIELLLPAFASAMKRQKEANLAETGTPEPLHLVIAGPCADPAYLQSLELLASSLSLNADTVTFLPMLQGEVKWGAFRSAEAFVLPSHQENFGIAVAEALACGVPVLLSNKVNIWREVVQDKAGLVAEDTIDGTTRLLAQWIALPAAARAEMSRRALLSFRTRFVIERAAESLLSTINDCLGQEGS
jgi:glycosyltransferase involved in cell wall biosynthesis